eukprot:scaffold221_cov191-Chaetoceros_neogracile.AAC.10
MVILGFGLHLGIIPNLAFLKVPLERELNRGPLPDTDKKEARPTPRSPPQTQVSVRGCVTTYTSYNRYPTVIHANP